MPTTPNYLSSMVLKQPNGTVVTTTIKDPNTIHGTQSEMAAMNSGISAADVTQITLNKNDIEALIEGLTALI